jgi:hypothetical protein
MVKTYDLILWSSNHTSRFPRNHRFVLGERIERAMYDRLEMLIQAKYTHGNKAISDEANLKLEILRFKMTTMCGGFAGGFANLRSGTALAVR